jgi:phospholipid/cholesterol/gamma-HCH transport system permease protein
VTPAGPARAAATSQSAPRVDARRDAARLEIDPAQHVLRPYGEWTACALTEADAAVHGWSGTGAWRVDASGLCALDSAGAWLLVRLQRRAARSGARLEWSGLSETGAALLALVRERLPPEPPTAAGRSDALERLGRAALAPGVQGFGLLAFIGELVVQGGALARRVRLARVVQEGEAAGVRALPILGLLAFLMGVVVAYQAGEPLQSFGANIFVVNLVAITMLREMGPLLAAIIVAGRTGSAYTAEIGTMRITEELDALRSIGVTPMEMLVLPKVLALTVVLPLLTLYASALGIAGGMVVADTLYGIGYADFVARLPHTFAPSTYWVGFLKAPVFALVIAAVACQRGLAVEHSPESIGRETTASVVQSIFLVIVADALFSVAFQRLGL